MSLRDLPGDIAVRVEQLYYAGNYWGAIADAMNVAHIKLEYGERVPEFSERIPQNLRTYRQQINKAFDAYIGALDGGAECAQTLGISLRNSALEYLRQEQYGEDLIRGIEEELI